MLGFGSSTGTTGDRAHRPSVAGGGGAAARGSGWRLQGPPSLTRAGRWRRSAGVPGSGAVCVGTASPEGLLCPWFPQAPSNALGVQSWPLEAELSRQPRARSPDGARKGPGTQRGDREPEPGSQPDAPESAPATDGAPAACPQASWRRALVPSVLGDPLCGAGHHPVPPAATPSARARGPAGGSQHPRSPTLDAICRLNPPARARRPSVYGCFSLFRDLCTGIPMHPAWGQRPQGHRPLAACPGCWDAGLLTFQAGTQC